MTLSSLELFPGAAHAAFACGVCPSSQTLSPWRYLLLGHFSCGGRPSRRLLPAVSQVPFLNPRRVPHMPLLHVGLPHICRGRPSCHLLPAVSQVPFLNPRPWPRANKKSRDFLEVSGFRDCGCPTCRLCMWALPYPTSPLPLAISTSLVVADRTPLPTSPTQKIQRLPRSLWILRLPRNPNYALAPLPCGKQPILPLLLAAPDTRTVCRSDLRGNTNP